MQTFLMDREFLKDFLEKLGKTLQKTWKTSPFQKVGDFINFVAEMSHDVSFDDLNMISQKKSYSAFIVLAKS